MSTPRLRPLALAALLGAAAFSSGCRLGPEIGSETNREVDLSGLSTYALLPLPDEVPNADPGTMLRLGPAIEEEIAAGMAALGYREAPREDADVVLNVKGRIVPRVRVTDWGFGYRGYHRWGRFYGPDVTVDEVREGTISIEAFPGDSKTLAWVGWATDLVGERIDVAELRAAIRGILARFPAAAGAPPPE